MKENKIYCMIDIGKTKSNKPGIATSPAITTNNHHQTDLFNGRINSLDRNALSLVSNKFQSVDDPRNTKVRRGSRVPATEVGRTLVCDPSPWYWRGFSWEN